MNPLTTADDIADRAARQDAATERAQRRNDAMRAPSGRGGVMYTAEGRFCAYCGVAMADDGSCSPECDGVLTVRAA